MLDAYVKRYAVDDDVQGVLTDDAFISAFYIACTYGPVWSVWLSRRNHRNPSRPCHLLCTAPSTSNKDSVFGLRVRVPPKHYTLSAIVKIACNAYCSIANACFCISYRMSWDLCVVSRSCGKALSPYMYSLVPHVRHDRFCIELFWPLIYHMEVSAFYTSLASLQLQASRSLCSVDSTLSTVSNAIVFAWAPQMTTRHKGNVSNGARRLPDCAVGFANSTRRSQLRLKLCLPAL